MLRMVLVAIIVSWLIACGGNTYSVPLHVGSNLGSDGLGVVYPGATMKVEDAVASILPQLQHGSVQYWTGTTWKVWTSDASFDTLLTLEHGKPYAITLDAPAVWTGK